MSSLMKQVEQRRQLPKAGDAGRDPADLAASQAASGTAADTDISPGSSSVSISDGGNADTVAAPVASVKDTRSASRPADRKVTRPSGGHRKQPTTDRKPRRVGRPRGPSRTPITVRILSELDDALTSAVQDSGQSPQYIVDEALVAWLTQRGYLPRNS